MLDTLSGWFWLSIIWVFQHWWLWLALLGAGFFLEMIFPCLFSHNPKKVIKIMHDSPNVQTSIIEFYCSRCGKKV